MLKQLIYADWLGHVLNTRGVHGYTDEGGELKNK